MRAQLEAAVRARCAEKDALATPVRFSVLCRARLPRTLTQRLLVSNVFRVDVIKLRRLFLAADTWYVQVRFDRQVVVALTRAVAKDELKTPIPSAVPTTPRLPGACVVLLVARCYRNDRAKD